MPRGGALEIFTNADLDIMDDLENDAQVEGVHYYLFWGNNQMPISFETLLTAYAAASQLNGQLNKR
jgi:hypothetical protein